MTICSPETGIVTQGLASGQLTVEGEQIVILASYVQGQ